MSEKTCIVFGAAGGIGRALVKQISAKGWKLVLAGRTLGPLEQLASEVGGVAVAVDAQDFDAVDAVFQSHSQATGAVNLVGSILLKPAHMTSYQEFSQTLDQNLRTAFAVTRAASKSMKAAGGSVVLVSSCAARIGLSNHEAISAAKAGIEGLVRSAAATYAPSKIRFNAVAPGLVATPMSKRITDNEAALKTSVAMHPLGRIAQPEEVARAIQYLLESESDFVTGQVLAVDGGLASLKTR
ncbi:MAG: SDR family oxidoreductase [Phycisphaerales bacterium]